MSTRPDGLPDRRTNRIELPQCPHCGSALVWVEARTGNDLFLRCSACDAPWAMPKPH